MRAARWVVRILAVLALPWVIPPVYRCENAPLKGEVWQPALSADLPWLKVNLHAHARAWLGLTNGHQASAQVLSAYRDAGYDVPALSNYMQIDPASPLRAYEHGFNAHKQHQLALGATSVFWFDQPVTTQNGLQFALDGIRQPSGLTVIPHPGDYTLDELKCLDGYDLMEVASRRRTWTWEWDQALSSGHHVYATGSDDVHDLDDREDWGTAWTMVQASGGSEAEVLTALREGKSYAVRVNSAHAPQMLHVESLSASGSEVHARFREEAEGVSCFAQGGRTVASLAHVREVTCALAESDGYLRIEAVRDGTLLLLNPAWRRDSTSSHRVDWPLSAAAWTGCALLWAAAEFLLRRATHRARVPRP